MIKDNKKYNLTLVKKTPFRNLEGAADIKSTTGGHIVTKFSLIGTIKHRITNLFRSEPIEAPKE